MIWNAINTVLIVIIGIIIFISKIFLRAYMDEKGKNLATKEDIGRITGEIESVRSRFEVVAHSGKEIFSKEYSLLEKVWEHAWELQARARDLRPILDILPDDPAERRKIEIQRINAYAQSMDNFVNGVFKKRPFIPESIYKIIKELHGAVIKEQTRVQSLNRGYSSGELTSEGIDNAGIFDTLIEKLNQSIRSYIFNQAGSLESEQR